MKEYMCKGAVDGSLCSKHHDNTDCTFMMKPHICNPLTCKILKKYEQVFCFSGNPRNSKCQCVPLPLEVVMKRIIKKHEKREKSG